MNNIMEKSKTWKSTKNWDRHARIIYVMQQKQTTVTEMSKAIDEHIQHVSACIWGVYGKKNPRIEEKIARFLKTEKTLLFYGDKR
jgi:hypothetical protein